MLSICLHVSTCIVSLDFFYIPAISIFRRELWASDYTDVNKSQWMSKHDFLSSLACTFYVLNMHIFVPFCQNNWDWSCGTAIVIRSKLTLFGTGSTDTPHGFVQYCNLTKYSVCNMFNFNMDFLSWVSFCWYLFSNVSICFKI
jgi:hypothetical protein